MNAAWYIGRIGGLAVALGVGAALFTGNGIAWAGPDSDDSSVSSESGSQDDSDASDSKPVKKTPAGPFGRIKTSTRSGSTAASTSQGDEGSSRTGRKTLADMLGAHRSATTPAPQSPSGTSGSTSTTPQPKRNRLRSSLTDLDPSASISARTTSGKDAINDVVVKAQSTVTSLLKPSVAVPQIASTPSTLPLVSIVKNFPVTRSAIVTPQSATPNAAQPTHSVANVLATVVNRVLSPSAGTTPTTPPVDQPATLVLLAALRRELSGAVANLDQSNATTASPTLVLNGYDVVPTSPEHVISFYGLFTSPPATPGSLQGTQEFKVVDQTGKTVGTFEAFISNSNSFVLGGGTYTELYVTDSTATEGSDPAATPPIGTLISSITFGKSGRLGLIYTSTPSGPDSVVSLKLTTPLKDIPIPLPYDGALVFTAVDRPFELNEDYYIAPAPGSPENITSISGIPPLFTVAQGEQVFNVYQKSDDGNDVVVGSFKGYVTTTSDALGATTEAILVTEVLGDPPVGTDPSQVPQVGSVYNVIYHFGVVYSANTPGPDDPPGDVVRVNVMTRFGDIPLPIKWDAAAIPDVESFEVPDQYSFVPTSDLQPIGVNGLPPREVEIQGYQQFDVYDSHGSKIGTVDADVTTHYGLGRTYTEAILVTDSSGGAPPPGSQFNFVVTPFRVDGFGLVYSAVPSDSGDSGDDVTTFIVVTPFGHFSIPAGYNAIKGLDDVEYFDPFVP